MIMFKAQMVEFFNICQHSKLLCAFGFAVYLGISRPFFMLIKDYVALKKGKHILTLRINVLEKRFPSKFESPL